MHLLYLNRLLLYFLISFLYLSLSPNHSLLLEGRKIVTLNKQQPVHVINPIQSEITNNSYKYKLLRKLNFLFFKKNENKYEMKNLENVPLFVVTNEFDEAILSFNVDYNKDEKESKKKNEKRENKVNVKPNLDTNSSYNHRNDSHEEHSISCGDNQHDYTFFEKSDHNKEELFPLIKFNQNRRREINLDNVHNYNTFGIFFFDLKTAEAYKDDILHLYNKNLKEKKNNKLFFGTKIKLTNLKYFLQLKDSHSSRIDFVLIPHYNQLQHVLKNKKVFYGTPVYYINKIILHKSVIKKSFYELFFPHNLKKKVQVELYPSVFLTYTLQRADGQSLKELNDGTKEYKLIDRDTLIIQLETKDGKKYIPIFFSFEQAYQFYKIFLDNFKSHFHEYCLPKPNISLNSFENLLTMLKMANENKIHPFYNIFFVPMTTSYDDKLIDKETNIFIFYAKKLFQRINYDLFRSFRKNMNYLISDYLYD
ncbi:hypothetical protein, conserved [Plasmodium gonderi]|uniref:Uncharacterized protein n=1 Tax=Plasmodium gonderi TaxID=77519 RepID=A0A1Y1JBA7_PLAGO|nr:hypothetical protein, conserved [Plasmodium gonderi]GAW79776.1 hypothetical protein, conserved [Plasmodium gonderi]